MLVDLVNSEVRSDGRPKSPTTPLAKDRSRSSATREVVVKMANVCVQLERGCSRLGEGGNFSWNILGSGICVNLCTRFFARFGLFGHFGSL